MYSFICLCRAGFNEEELRGFVDVLLLDLQMPTMDGLETITHVKRDYPSVRILMLTTNDEGSIITTIFKNGATGYLLKNSSQEILMLSKGKKYSART